MAKKEEEKEVDPPAGSVPIEWHFPENLTRRYANNMIVQRMENEFVISFFEIVPPIIIGSLEDKIKQAEEVKSVRANCVASIILSPAKMGSFIQALQENFKRFIDDIKKEQDVETSTPSAAILATKKPIF